MAEYEGDGNDILIFKYVIDPAATSMGQMKIVLFYDLLDTDPEEEE
jgi:hypothetical protein